MAESTPLTRITKPLADLFMLNAETTAAILLRQTATVSELLQASVENTRAVVAAKDLGEAFRLQQEYGREAFEKVSATGRDNWNTLRDAMGKAGDVVRTAVRPQAAA